MSAIARSVLRPRDLLALGFQGTRAHPLRAALSALGIAIGIGAMIAVIGISTSSQALVQEKLATLGTNVLTITAGNDVFGNPTALPVGSAAKGAMIDGVETIGWTAPLPGINVYRSSLIDPGATRGLSVGVADTKLPAVLNLEMASGTWLDAASAGLPVTVLGNAAAQILGVVGVGEHVVIGGETFAVGGVLAPALLAPELDTVALMGAQIATTLFGFDGAPAGLYLKAADAKLDGVRAAISATINPQAPEQIQVSRPSDALAAKNTVDQAFTGLLVGVGSIALLVGGIGVANTMVITVLERRREIGLRRALGATRRHITQQFLLEAVILAAYGGLAGTVLGVIVTGIVASSNGWLFALPAWVMVAGVVITALVGAAAGALPAIRAARTAPTVVLNG